MTWPQNPDWATILPKLPVATSPPNDDTDDLDTDTDTDSFLLAAWVSILGEWPNQTLPINLMTLTFNIQSGASGTTPINIMTTSSAAGFTFDGQNHTVNLDGSSTVNIPSVSSTTQHVYVSSSTKSADGTQEIVTIGYNSDDTTVTGIGLRIHYDDSALQLTDVANVFETELFIRPESSSGASRDELIAQASGRVFRTMNPEELELFDYVAKGYIEDNPNETTRDSYVGNYQFGVTGP
jgi:hypothetical protein